MVTADTQFRLTANAAAARYHAPPPYLAYHTISDIDVPALKRHKRIDRDVETRTADDLAVIQDLPRGQRQYGQSFPLIPTFDALSYFRLEFNGAQRDLLAHVKVFQPLTFSDPQASSAGGNVVATTLRNYYATYAPDSSETKLHLTMAPLPALTTGNTSDFYLHDVFVDPATNLPTRVTYVGRDDTEFTLDYTVQAGYWLVNHAFYGHSIVAPLHLGRVHFTVDTSFDGFAFPERPADPRLAEPLPPATSPPR